jgi:hypothetical protein
MKYAFEGREDPALSISLTLTGSQVSLVVEDTGDIRMARGEGIRALFDFGI